MRVNVIGGGIIGLTIAWECRRRGHDVTVTDPSPQRAASQVAAGMLAPVGEAYFGEEALTALLIEAARQWPAFVDALGEDVGYRTEGTLQIGLTADDVRELSRLWRYQESLGCTVERVVPQDIEPLLSPRARGVRVRSDHQVDPRRVVSALARSVTIWPEPVEADLTVVAAGCGSAQWGLPVRPVKGVLLRLRGPVGLSHVIRGAADGQAVYLVPRDDGEVIVGATSEERTDFAAGAGAVRDLLRAATDLVPDLAEHALAETCVGHRPGTPDNAPIVGRLDEKTLVATGHYRHGVLAAPLTAMAIADLVDGKPLPPLWHSFSPGRFS
ncbi:FAD-dependent oxidoreductase [Allorhizocola rhizosphaerae]|uniref:FAD-dependent oxidoreductase n=1 Tax=Allorhizocola rhizosphaerae TaxID=1872709 RepID=UPI000E3BB602|nr:FAD-dependent oxidoreductase [Allorhizocola rhizosphaerae]